jgi:hypothetical protein
MTVAGRATAGRTADARTAPGGTAPGGTAPAGRTAPARMVAGQWVVGQQAAAGTWSPDTPTRRSWKQSRTPSIPATGTPATPTRAARARGRPICPPVLPGPVPSAACRARPVRRARRARHRETQPRPTTAPGSPPRVPSPAPAAPGRRPGPGPARPALVPGNRGHLVFARVRGLFARVRGLPISRTIPPSPETPHHPGHARPAPRGPTTGARKPARPAGHWMGGSKGQGRSSPTARAAIRTVLHRQAGNSAARRSAAAQ